MRHASTRMPLHMIAATSWIPSTPLRWRQHWWRLSPCICTRTSAWRTGSDYGINIISSPSQPLSMLRDTITWAHGSPEKHRNTTSNCKSLPPSNCGTAQGWQRNKCMGSPPSNIPKFYPGIKRIESSQHSARPPIVNPPFRQLRNVTVLQADFASTYAWHNH